MPISASFRTGSGTPIYRRHAFTTDAEAAGGQPVLSRKVIGPIKPNEIRRIIINRNGSHQVSRTLDVGYGPNSGPESRAAVLSGLCHKRTSAVIKQGTCASALRCAYSPSMTPTENWYESRGKPYGVRTALLAIKKISLHRPFPFHVKRPAGLEAERIAECLAGGSGNMDPAS